MQGIVVKDMGGDISVITFSQTWIDKGKTVENLIQLHEQYLSDKGYVVVEDLDSVEDLSTLFT